MLSDLEALLHEARYEPAFTNAKRRSIELLNQDDFAGASRCLSFAGLTLCEINHPAKARSFAQEAADLAARSKDPLASASAEAARALSHLRLREVERAEVALEHAFHLLRPLPPPDAAVAKMVAAELALVQDDIAEARAFAEDLHAIASAGNDAHLISLQHLLKAICDDRSQNPDAALEHLAAAESALGVAPSRSLLWKILGARANLLARLSRVQADSARTQATSLVEQIARDLKPDFHDRFLRHPAVRSALGKSITPADLTMAPLQIPMTLASPHRPDGELAALRPIFEVLKKINTEVNLRNLITLIVDTMIEHCNALRGTIVIFEGDHLKFEISRDRLRRDLRKSDMGVSRTILMMVRDRGEKIVTENATYDPVLKLIDSVSDQRLCSILCIPLRVKNRLIGAVYLDNSQIIGAFGDREQELAEILTDQAAVSIDNALLRSQSIHDPLTSVYNHAHFEQRLEQEFVRARRHNRCCGVMMLDLDNFKQINDTYGHETGNEVLRMAARKIVGATRTTDLIARIQEQELTPLVARYGGDEFEVMLPDITREGIQRVGERILSAINETHFEVEGHKIPVLFSIGASLFPDDADDARSLILRADQALYAAKRAGKNCFLMWTPPSAATPQPAK